MWSERLYQHAQLDGVEPGNWFLGTGIGQGDNDYSIGLVDTSTANTERRVRRKTMFNGFFNIESDELVPFNLDWRPPGGSDGFLVVEDASDGREWDYWNISFPGYQRDANDSRECINGENAPPPLGVGFDASSDLCAASAALITGPDGTVADMRTYRGNFPGAGGGGLPNGPGLVRPSEVAAGAIRHAWKLATVNTMTGPECSPKDRDDPTKFGTTCGSAVAPAGIFERVARQGTAESITKSVPEGMRFSIDLTDDEIDAWLNDRQFTGTLRTTARVMAESLRDYGWFLVDTTTVGAILPLAGGANADTAEAWRSLGLDETSGSLLHGLFREGRIVTWEVPTNRCADGTSSIWYCWAADIDY